MIDDQQGAVRAVQHSVTDRPDELLEALMIAGTDDEHLHSTTFFGQVIERAAAHGYRLHPGVWIASRPTGKPAIKVGNDPTVAIRGCAVAVCLCLSTADCP